MWILFAFLSALFAGLTAILAKIGIRGTDSDAATAIRTVVILLFSWLMVFLTGAQGALSAVRGRPLLFLMLSGLATGASWLCYFKALQMGDVNKVTPIDKSSTVLTMLLAFVLLGEPATWLKLLGMALIGVGTYLMIVRKAGAAAQTGTKSGAWMLYALLSAVFAALTSILGKIGVTGIDSNVGTAIRTLVVLVMAWTVVLATGKGGTLRGIDRRSMAFICLSGVTTGLSWLCYYRALQTGQASVVVPIDRLSVLLTVAFSSLVLHEHLTKKALLGLALITAGTLVLLIPA